MHVGRCCCAICCRCIALWHSNILNMLWFVNLWRLYASWITSATSRWQPKGFWHYCWHGNWKCKKNGWANGWPSNRCGHLFFMMRISSAKFVNMMLVIWNHEFYPCKHDVFCFVFTGHMPSLIHPYPHLTISEFWHLHHSLFVFYSQRWCCISFFTSLIIVIRRGETYITAPSFIKSYLKHQGPWSLHDLNASSWKGISFGRLLIWMASTAVSLHPLLLYR